MRQQLLVDVIDVRVETHGPNPFGTVKAAEVILFAILRDCVVVPAAEDETFASDHIRSYKVKDHIHCHPSKSWQPWTDSHLSTRANRIPVITIPVLQQFKEDDIIENYFKKTACLEPCTDCLSRRHLRLIHFFELVRFPWETFPKTIRGS